MILLIDIGGTYTKYGHLNIIENINDNNIDKCLIKMHKKGRWDTTFNYEELMLNIDNVIPQNLTKICISSGGFWKDEKCISYATIPVTSSGNFIRDLKMKYSCNVVVENDARCALIAESNCGFLKGVENGAMVVLGSSIGCAIKVNGKLYKGNTSQAGSVFMMPEQICNDKYKFDYYGNTVTQLNEYKKHKRANMNCTMIDIENEYLNQCEISKDIIDNYAKVVALKCWYIYLMYDPALIVLGGGLSNSELIVNLVKRNLNEYFIMDKSKRIPEIIVSSLKDESNLIGAAMIECNVEKEKSYVFRQ